MIYFDQAATSDPKPAAVLAAVVEGLTKYNANAGRSAYSSALAASSALLAARKKLAAFFGCADFHRLIFTNNTTQALNLALKGLLVSGDHLIYSPFEHNSVYRPLGQLAQLGVQAEMAHCNAACNIDLADVEARIRPNTKLLVFMHASNVTGSILPIRELGALARKHNLLLLVDAAQTAGILPLDVEEMQIDLLAFAGHKGLYGPMGSGGLYVGERAEAIRPLLSGGTGSQSHSQQQPQAFPDRLECGTLPLPAILGLAAGVAEIEQRGVAQIAAQTTALTRYFMEGARQIAGITIYGAPAEQPRVAVVSLNLAGWSPSELSVFLEEKAEIAVRSGFHCSPLAHRAIGTDSSGAVRFSFGYGNTRAEIDIALAALSAAAAARQ